MKNLTLFCILICSLSLFFSSCTKEETISSEESYLGPANTAELTLLLETSTDPVLTNLSSSTKKSLIDYTVFEGGILRGWSHKDDNLKKLDSTNILEVLSVIVKAKVVSKGQKAISSGGGTHCKNCYWERGHDGCCHVGGSGCYEAG